MIYELKVEWEVTCGPEDPSEGDSCIALVDLVEGADYDFVMLLRAAHTHEWRNCWQFLPNVFNYKPTFRKLLKAGLQIKAAVGNKVAFEEKTRTMRVTLKLSLGEVYISNCAAALLWRKP